MHEDDARDILKVAMILMGCFLFAALMIGASVFPVDGRDLQGRYVNSPLHDWFQQLSSGKGPCCSDADGQTVLDADWKSDQGHYVVRIHNKSAVGEPLIWVVVPDEAVLKEPNRDGRTIVWPIWNGEALPFIRCFIPGAGI